MYIFSHSRYAYASGLVDVVKNANVRTDRIYPEDNEEEENT